MPKNIPNPVQTLDVTELQLAVDIQGFDDHIRNIGVTMIHMAAMRCPVGLSSEDDTARPLHHHQDCVNGFVLTKKGEVTVLFQGNTHQSTDTPEARLEGANVQISVPRFYDDRETPVELLPYDRLYLKEDTITVPEWELFTHSLTGVDKLSFPVVKVADLMDSKGKIYRQGEDFTVQGGNLVWTGVGPGMEPSTKSGVVCSVRYSYRPYWVVSKLLHEVRVAHSIQGDGSRKVVKLPQTAMLQREYLFRASDPDPQVPSPRQTPGPSKSIYPAK